MTPFLKWAGGKRWLVSQHDAWLRNNAKRYIEPFLGSGAVFFHMQPTSAILSDINAELVATYQALRDTPLKVRRHLLAHHRMHSIDHYYHVRQQAPRTAATQAARFIYLNRTCFNGLYRVNLKGVFNVPKGTKEKVILPSDDFENVSALLQATALVSCDFADTIRQAKSGDFLYIDPPYTVRHNNNNFLKYNEHIFSWADQKRLAVCLAEAARRGVSILISNADHPCIHELYGASYWQRMTVDRFSRLASSAKHRRGTTEAVISNYLKENGEQEDPRY
ncbi:MAG: Dam family site-specific DNA-(adenine-N6)-methyltransferase [Desulfuromusa sp.]|nr:Dam family site-specific DNA-(adenine-N6)-methyltransferase [Desulfuromusa sp.]